MVNQKAVRLAPGMLVRHAIQTAGLMPEINANKRVYDDWGNEVKIRRGLVGRDKIVDKVTFCSKDETYVQQTGNRLRERLTFETLNKLFWDEMGSGRDLKIWDF